jgi:large subunit ribosomal protein MRP49
MEGTEGQGTLQFSTSLSSRGEATRALLRVTGAVGWLYAQEQDGMLTTYRKFWREMLPRIKYRNPSVPIEIARHTNADGPSLLHIYTATKTQPTAGSTNSPTTQQSDEAPPSGTPNARHTLVPDTSKPTYTINIRDQTQSEILEALVKETGAQELQPTQQELAEIQEIKEFKERSEADRVQVREGLLKERREAELLKLARGEVPVAN